MKNLVSCLFSTLVLTLAAPVLAEPEEASPTDTSEPSEQDLAIAEQHHELALTLYKAGDFTAAAAEFSKSFSLSRNTGVLYNLASAQRKAQQCVAAETSYKLYAEMVPGGGGAKSQEVQQYLQDLSTCAEEEREQERKEAQKRQAALINKPKAGLAEPEVTMGTSPARSNTWRYTSIGISAAGLLVVGTGIYFGLSANSAADDLTDRFSTTGETWDQEAIDLEDRHDRHKTLSYISTGVGVTLVLTGGVLFLLDLDAPTERSPTGLSNLRVSPKRDGLTLGWSIPL